MIFMLCGPRVWMITRGNLEVNVCHYDVKVYVALSNLVFD